MQCALESDAASADGTGRGGLQVPMQKQCKHATTAAILVDTTTALSLYEDAKYITACRYLFNSPYLHAYDTQQCRVLSTNGSDLPRLQDDKEQKPKGIDATP
ncbi:hypothetical protein CCM_07603 [Cordyceps militaris CM01]|uniref:Uncharacterized protein n=1 Tax=Cordyceps militaris (strain CM01) TaxID=983644 RepID=G3JQA1_CORMM|nr:uncharacterized protein CCM_07603 [Cordyceps militaris CM01]EGX89352.1 hypothetical protein CCM_07603 [Cordyceps militaris CM01]